MCNVFEAEDTLLKKNVALKILNKKYKENEEVIRLFQNEAFINAKLHHHNIVKIFKIDYDHDRLFIVLELLNGPNLETLINESRISEELFYNVFKQMLNALIHIHSNKIYHNDIKPSNIAFNQSPLLNFNAKAKIIDFGLASNKNYPNTNSQIWATPYYSSPEKINGSKEDYTSDLYSLASTMYHIICKQAPFNFENAENIEKDNDNFTKKILDQKKIPPHIYETIGKKKFQPSKKVCDIIHKMMQFNPKNRYQTANEVLESISTNNIKIRKKKTKKLHISKNTKTKIFLIKNKYLILFTAFLLILFFIIFNSLLRKNTKNHPENVFTIKNSILENQNKEIKDEFTLVHQKAIKRINSFECEKSLNLLSQNKLNLIKYYNSSNKKNTTLFELLNDTEILIEINKALLTKEKSNQNEIKKLNNNQKPILSKIQNLIYSARNIPFTYLDKNTPEITQKDKRNKYYKTYRTYKKFFTNINEICTKFHKTYSKNISENFIVKLVKKQIFYLESNLTEFKKTPLSYRIYLNTKNNLSNKIELAKNTIKQTYSKKQSLAIQDENIEKKFLSEITKKLLKKQINDKIFISKLKKFDPKNTKNIEIKNSLLNIIILKNKFVEQLKKIIHSTKPNYPKNSSLKKLKNEKNIIIKAIDKNKIILKIKYAELSIPLNEIPKSDLIKIAINIFQQKHINHNFSFSLLTYTYFYTLHTQNYQFSTFLKKNLAQSFKNNPKFFRDWQNLLSLTNP